MAYNYNAGRGGGGGGRGGSFYKLKFFFAKKKVGGGGGRRTIYKFFFPYNIFFLNCSWGRETQKKKLFFWRGSENDTLLPMSMTRNRQKFWNRLGGQKLSSGNLGGGRIKKILTKS